MIFGVKCDKDHPTSTCKKTPDSPATCINCSGNHPASYKGCTKYKEYKNQVTSKIYRKTPIKTTQSENQTKVSSGKNTTYSQVVKQNKDISTQRVSNISQDQNTDTAHTIEKVLSKIEILMEKMMDKMIDRMILLVSNVLQYKK